MNEKNAAVGHVQAIHEISEVPSIAGSIAVSYTRLLQGPDVLYCFLIWYFAVFQINILVAVLHDIHRRRNERQEARKMAEGEKSRLRA